MEGASFSFPVNLIMVSRISDCVRVSDRAYQVSQEEAILEARKEPDDRLGTSTVCSYSPIILPIAIRGLPFYIEVLDLEVSGEEQGS